MSDQNGFPMNVSVIVMSAAQLTSVYALLGGAAAGALASRAAPVFAAPAASPSLDAGVADNVGTATEAPASPAPASDGTLDAHGHPWSPELHASTQTKTKDGLWRMKIGVSRPAPKPGFPVETPGGATGTSPSTAAAGSTGSASVPTAGPATGEDEDEFAAFRAAADRANATDATAAANVAPRKWTDADIGALCNQAAVKLGDPAPVKAVIAEYIPAGQVAHSRNIPDDKREAFAKALEAKAGIQFGG